MEPWATIKALIERDGVAALVTVARADGSTPREAGARMTISRDGTITGSIGGGPLEWAAIDTAMHLMGRGRGAKWDTVSLGPALDQCCGGRAEILHESFDSNDISWITSLASHPGASIEVRGKRDDAGPYRRHIIQLEHSGDAFERTSSGELIERFGEDKTTVFLFGAGHVGRALVTALAPLPFSIRWIDDRGDAFKGAAIHGASTVVSALPESELRTAPDGSIVIIMTRSHALDLALVAAALPDPRFAYVGLIGSATKRTLFQRRLAEFGVLPESIGRLVCPIGVPGISGKSPPVIAAAVAAELLLVRERLTGLPKVGTELALG